MDRKLRVAFLTPYSLHTASTRQRIYKNAALFPPEVEVAIYASQTRDEALAASPSGRLAAAAELGRELARKLRHIWAARRYDVVVVQKGLTLHNWRGLPALLSALCPRLVYDFDDAVHLASPRGFRSRLLSRLTDPHQALDLMRRARVVTAGNRHLLGVAASVNRCVYLVPTPMDTGLYRPRPVRRDGPFVLGWSGSTATNPYVMRAAPVVRRLARLIKGFVFEVISNDDRGIDWSQFAPAETRFKRFDLDRIADDLHDFDAGIMPLDDDEWSRSKCGGKILQYMACAIPPVCSPVGINAEIVHDGVNGYLAASEDEWVEKISRLAADPGLRERVGGEARSTIERGFSNQVAAPLLLAAIREAAAGTSRVDRRI